MTASELVGARPRRTQRQRREQAENRVIQAAVELIAEKGVQGLSLSEVGERAGYSRGLPAAHFGSRSALVAHAAQQVVGRFADRVDEHLNGVSGLPAVLRFVGDYLDNAQSDPVSVRALLIVLAEARINPDLDRDIRELNTRTVERIAEAIGDGQACGEIRVDIDATTQARIVLGATRGAVGQWLADPQHVDIPAMRTGLLATVERGLLP